MNSDNRLTGVWEVFWRFLLLGCTSFGGPAAHIGYFRKAFVEENTWLDEARFGRLVSLSQFLPGPGSSQLGFAIGLHRAGLAGAIAAFLGFTLPSFLLMLSLMTSGDLLAAQPWYAGVLHGLKLLAVVVVADACLGMSRTFCPDLPTTAIALFAVTSLLLIPGILPQLAVLLLAGLVGGLLLRVETKVKVAVVTGRPAWLPLGLFVVFLICLLVPALADRFIWSELARDFFVAGSLVFGGGHVVLPLLEPLIADDLGREVFLTGYAAAQAVPGPMFTMATYLGGSLAGLTGAIVATLAVFLPGFLLLLAFHDVWHSMAEHPVLAGGSKGINAAVVGLLVAALYDPVFLTSVLSHRDMALVLTGLFALKFLRVNLALLVVAFMFAGWLGSVV